MARSTLPTASPSSPKDTREPASVRRVVQQLNVPDAALMRLLEPFELALKEVEPFHVTHDRGLPRSMCSL